jgi:hypothetical protein
MENSKYHKAAAEPPLDCRVSGLKRRHGFVLVTPQREIVAETFRPTREAAKGWLIMLEVDGRYERWDWFYRRGWRCRPAELLVGTKPDNG